MLDLPDLPVRLTQVLAPLAGDRPLLVCGGGAAVDIVRTWHRDLGLDEEQSHWLALEAVRLNQSLLLTLMPQLSLVSNRAAAESIWLRGGIPLLDLLSFMSLEESAAHREPNPEIPPHTWDVTSDSLAAWVTLRWPASRLILLKSTDCPTATSGSADENPAVDVFFSKLLPSLPQAEWINLRSAGSPGLVSFH